MPTSEVVWRGPRPILVTGMARAGTTWVGLMLNESRCVGLLNEPFNLATPPGTFHVPVDNWYPYITRENEDSVLRTLRRGLQFRYPLLAELRRCRTRDDLLLTARTWKRFQASRGCRPLVKEPHAVLSAEWFARRLGSHVVVVVRHPAAIVSSWKRLDWSFDFHHLLEQRTLLHERLEAFEQDVQAALEPSVGIVERVSLLWRVIYHVVAEYRKQSPDVVVVRQEDLARNPVEEFEKLFNTLALPYTRAIATAVAASSAPENPKETRVEFPHETKIDSRANLENWKRRLSAEEIGLVKTTTEPTASLFYSQDDWS